MPKIEAFSFSGINADCENSIKSALLETFDSKWYILGKQVEEFETRYAKLLGSPYCIGVGNGLDALTLIFRSLNLGPNDEIIVPSHTYIATWLAPLALGCKLLPVEPYEDSFQMDHEKVENLISNRTKAILTVNLYGLAEGTDKLAEIATNYNIPLIEDNAQATGSTLNGKFCGTFGVASAHSFYPTKNLGALGDAGAVCTSSQEITEKVKLLRNYGSKEKYYNEVIGINSRLDEMQAAVLNAKMPYLKQWQEQKDKIANWYFQELSGSNHLSLPKVADGCVPHWHQFVIQSSVREQLIKQLEKAGVGYQIHYPIPVHLQEATRHLGFQKGEFPLAEKIAETCISLPLWPGLSESSLQKVASALEIKAEW